MSNVLSGMSPLVGEYRRIKRPWAIALAAPAAILVLACGYVGWAFAEGRSRTVWVVNGLDREYDVSVNGQAIHLAAFSGQPVKIAEGEIHVAAAVSALPVPEQTCEICTPLWTRPFDNTTFVINPDHSALLFEDQTLYATDVKEAHDSDHLHYFTGDLLYRVPGVDYPFTDFPETVKVSGGRTQKKRLGLWSKGDEFQRLRLVSGELGRDAANEYACNQALCYPDDRQALMVALSRLRPTEVMAFIRAGLDRIPVWIVWHRAYQEMIERSQSDYDLASEYQSRLRAHPDNSTLMYLLGRVTRDKAQRDELFEKSTQGPAPCAYGFFARAYDALAQGQFDPALRMISRAIELAPNEQEFQGIKVEALGGLNRIDDLLNILREQEATEPMNPQVLLAKVRLLATEGKSTEARDAVAMFVARASGPENGARMRHLQAHAQALIRYSEGDESGFAESLLKASDSPGARFQAAVCLNHLDEAAVALTADPNASASDHLLLYVLATKSHHLEMASEHLKIAITGYRHGGPSSVQVAQWLSGAERIDPDAACALSLLPRQKKIALVGLGVMDPEHRQRYFNEAAKLNYDKVFPYWTIKQVIDAD